MAESTKTAVAKYEATPVAVAAPVERVMGEEIIKSALRFAQLELDSGLLPTSIKTVEAEALIVLRAWEDGGRFTHARSRYYVVNNQIAMYATAMLADVRRSGKATFEFEEGEGFCRVTGTRRDNGDNYTAEWTTEKAQKARLLGKDNWRSYPANMLRARAIAECCRVLAPDVVGNVYSVEELQDVSPATPKPERLEAKVTMEQLKAGEPDKDEPRGGGAVKPQSEQAPDLAEPAQEQPDTPPPSPPAEEPEQAPEDPPEAPKPPKRDPAAKASPERIEAMIAAFGNIKKADGKPLTKKDLAGVFRSFDQLTNQNVSEAAALYAALKAGTKKWEDVLEDHRKAQLDPKAKASAEAIEAMIADFAGVGVSRDELEETLGDLDELTNEGVSDAAGVHAAIKAGKTTWPKMQEAAEKEEGEDF